MRQTVGYARLYDDTRKHPKARKAGLAAMGLWAMGLSYCSEHATDGLIRREDLIDVFPWADKKTLLRNAEKLVRAGLWELDEAGDFHVHDYTDHQRSADETLALRERNADKMRAFRRRNADKTPDDISQKQALGEVVTGNPSREEIRDKRSENINTPLPPEFGGSEKAQLTLVPSQPEHPPPEQLVVDAYRQVFPDRLLPGRSKTKLVLGQIRQRLKENFTVEQLSAAAVSIAQNPYVDASGKRFDALAVAMRDEDQVRKYLPRQMASPARAAQPLRAADVVNAVAAEFGYPKIPGPDAELFLEIDPQLQTMRTLMKSEGMTPKKLYVAMKEACEVNHAAG